MPQVNKSINNPIQRYDINTCEYEIRYEERENGKHIVVPVVMMVEGVHHGSHGPVFHSIEELGKYPASWNGIPVCIQHPQAEGQGISANDPDIIESESVGRVYYTKVEDNKLKGEVWLNVEKLEQVSTETLLALQQKQPLDVSLGMFTDNELIEGVWQNEQYIGVAHNHRPDHLALLPGATGACSWEDGCGIRNNMKGGELMNFSKIVKEMMGKGYAVVQINVGMQELLQQMREKIDSLDNSSKIHYLEELFDNVVVYRISSRADDIAPVSRLVKRPYTYENGVIEFTDDPVLVKREVSYTEISESYQLNKEDKNMTNKKTSPCCAEKVELLIQSEHSTFVDGDRDWLNGLEETQIDKFLTMQVNAETLVQQAAELQNNSTDTTDNTNDNISEEQAIQVLESHLSDPKKFMKLLPKDLRNQFDHGIKLHTQYRDELITKILNNTEIYSKEDLMAMDDNGLDKLSRAISIPTDYSIQGSHLNNSNTEVGGDPLLPLNV